MAKLKSPFLAFKAGGRLGKLLSLRPRGRQTIAETRPIPPDAKSPAQLSWRHMYQKATALWHALSAAEKQEWETNARPKHMTGYAWFMSQCLKPNPGIYLPLQGGTMSGNINMATNRILDLPLPDAVKEPIRKVDLSTHAGKNTVVHGVGADYIAKADGSQYIAVNRGGDTKLGLSFGRDIDNSLLRLKGGSSFPAQIDLCGKNRVGYPGCFLIAVPNAAGTALKHPFEIWGHTDNPIIYPGADNETDLGDSFLKWRHVYTHGLTHDQLCVTDRKCAKCGKEFQVDDVWAYSVIKLSGDFTVKQPRIVKKRHKPELPATETMAKLNEWTGKYEDITRPVMVKIKRQHYYVEDGQVIQEEIEEEVENEYDAIDGEIEIPADGFMTCAPVCRLCFLKV